MRMSSSKVPKDIDEYLARVPEPARTTLRKIRATIREVAFPAPPGEANKATTDFCHGLPGDVPQWTPAVSPA